ncbi:uncharacterized protein LOC128953173 isoform X2 [Oppia nitens]|uniref:uncharacterized protein LOC128953173 isoform X2 n=1 Tax=Oppia nitens TaxID=1686743 RepID=UPI0023DA358E|nr:uncharacterized protein LOC128953173 isoform X2 [Oppia nitens]
MGSVVLALVLLIICVSALTFFMVNRNVNLWDESSSSSSTLSSTISPKLSPNIESEFLDNQQREERLEKGSKVILGEFILSNRHYSPALDSQSSQDFQSFASDVVKSMDEMFLESPLAKIYNLTQVYEFSESDTKVGLVVRCRILLNIELLTAAQEVGLTFINALERRHGRLPAGNLRVDITSIKFTALSTASAAATSIASPTQMAGPVLHPLPPSFSGRPETTNVATDDVPPTNVYAISGGNANSDDDNSNNDGKGSPPESTKQTSGHDSMVVVDHNKPVPIVKPTVNNNNNGIVISGDGFPNKVPQSVVKMPIDITISVSGNTDGDSSDNNNNHEEKVPITSDNNGSGNDGVTAFWSNWSEWSPCRGLNGKCDSGRIHSRIRKCLAQSGEVVNSDVCRVIQREQQELEIRDCRCDQEQESHHFMVNTTNVTDSTHLLEKPDRACNDCKQDEICLLQVKAAVPFCAKIKDPRDPRGCGGWCSGHKELCRYVGAQTYQCVDDSECLDGEWQCANGLCIPESRRCDGHFNCFDMSDEMHCQCKEDEFHCGNKTSCLPLSQRCDGIIHCWDGEDEQNCTKLCSENQFTCNSGQCIPIEAFCDSHRHCTDGSDEPDGCNSTIGNNGGTNTCKSHEYQCRNGKCISRSQVCDGDNHCGDGSDERDCRPQLQQQQQRRKQQQLQQQQQQQHSSGISQTS